MAMLKSEEAYYSEIYEELLNSEVSHQHEFNNCDVDYLIIEEIEKRIWAKLTETNDLTPF